MKEMPWRVIIPDVLKKLRLLEFRNARLLVMLSCDFCMTVALNSILGSILMLPFIVEYVIFEKLFFVFGAVFIHVVVSLMSISLNLEPFDTFRNIPTLLLPVTVMFVNSNTVLDMFLA